MPCPVCDWIKDVLNRPRAPPVLREEQFATAIPRALGFDVREPEWHEPGGKVRDVIGTHKVVRRLTPKQKRRANKMSRAMSKVSRKARKKDGSLKKGWSQSRIMKEAHKEVERMK